MSLSLSLSLSVWIWLIPFERRFKQGNALDDGTKEEEFFVLIAVK